MELVIGNQIPITITNYIVFQLSNYDYNYNYFKNVINCNWLQLQITITTSLTWHTHTPTHTHSQTHPQIHNTHRYTSQRYMCTTNADLWSVLEPTSSTLAALQCTISLQWCKINLGHHSFSVNTRE